MSKSIRASACALALFLSPGILFADDRDHGRRHGDRNHSRGPSAHREVSHEKHHDHRHHRSRRCGCVETVIPGYYRTVVETIRTPGHYERVWVPAPRIRIGRHVEVGLDLGCYENVWVPGECREVSRKVWVPPRTVVETRCRRHCR